MKRFVAALIVVLISVAALADEERIEDRVKNAGVVLKEILNIPDDIPQDLLDKAECVIIMPSVIKAAFGVGGSFGRGLMICRSGEHYKGKWGAPAMYALEGASIGFQIGGQATDFVLLVMNEGGARGILAGKVKLGGDASIAAGPVGRDASAETDVTLRSEILSYSRARGVFAGISLEGSTIRPDNKANEQIYGKKLEAKQLVLSDQAAVPAAAEQLISTLDAKTPQRKP
jgi:SH3 domain-containing YSC84-like protein 1